MQKRTDEEIAGKHRAYSLLDVKSIIEREDSYLIKGTASTPRVDRMGDIVEPLGARFSLPMPLLWQHMSTEPVGHVVMAKPTKKGIPFEAEIPKVKEAGALKDRIDEAIQSIKYRLVAAVSIGFKVIDDALEMLDNGGLHFLEWEWLELSLVTIPANPEATITEFKSFDDELRAALRAKQRSVVRLEKTVPGATGSTAVKKPKGNTMTYKELIAAAEATRAAKAARMAEIQKSASDAGGTKDDAQREEFDTLRDEIKTLDVEIKDLRDLEKLNVEAAAPVDDKVTTAKAAALSGPRVQINAKVEPGIRFARMAMCLARAKYLQKEGRFQAPDEIYRGEKRWMDSAPDVALAMKAAVNGLDSTTSGAASEWAYAQNIAAEFVEYLRPRTLIGRIQGWRRVPFNVRVGAMDGGSSGYWVGQGVGIKVSKPTSTSISLGITKVGGLAVITKELAMLSTPSAEAMVREDLAKAIQQKADTTLISPHENGETNVAPASLTSGVTPRSASGTDFAAFKADWKAITSPLYAAHISLAGAVVIMKEELAEALSMMVTSLGLPQFPSMQDWANGNGRLMGHQVFTTQVADTSGSPDYDNMLILVQPAEVFLADDGGASVEASDQVSVHMDDATTMKSTPTATSTSVVSMFQTESIAIKGIRHVNWTKARSQACQFIRSANYV